MKKILLALLAILSGTAHSQPASAPLTLLREMQGNVDRWQSGRLNWQSQELVKDKLGPERTRHIVYSGPRIYLKAIEGPETGAEVIFRPGWNEGKTRAHRGSFPDIKVNLDPHSPWMLGQTHHPIEYANLRHFVRAIFGPYRADTSDALFIYQGETTVRGQAGRKILITNPPLAAQDTVRAGETLWTFSQRVKCHPYWLLHVNGFKKWELKPAPSTIFSIPRYYGGKIELVVAKASKLPIQIIVYDLQGRMYEKHQFWGFDSDTPITDGDFDPKNPNYNF